MPIKAIWCILENELLVEAAATFIFPPTSVLREAERVLISRAITKPGELIRFVQANGFAETRVTRHLSDEDVTALIREIGGGPSENANVRVITEYSRYNIVAVLDGDQITNMMVSNFIRKFEREHKRWWQFWIR